MGNNLTHYTQDQKNEAAILFASKGVMSKVSRALDIPETTLAEWKNKSEWWDGLVVAVRSEKSQEHIAKYNQMVDLAQDKAITLIPGITSAREATLVACMSQDKGLLLQGKPTSISGKSGDIQALAKQFKELSEQWNEKQVNVVSTQHEDKSST
jgi:hypothetical protein